MWTDGGETRITLTREDERKKEMRDDQLVGNNEGGYVRERRAILGRRMEQNQ
jgi:hypothetical protein